MAKVTKTLETKEFAPGYLIREDGVVFTLWKRRGFLRPEHVIDGEPRILKPFTAHGGYPKVKIVVNGERKALAVHLIVLEAFVGPRPEGMHGCHNNGDPTDNRPENLRWDTPRGNAADRMKHGTEVIGERCPKAKLTPAIVREIRAIPAGSASTSEIARRYGVTGTAIQKILRRKSWAHIAD